MRTKRTIAAIAAVIMAASSVNALPFAVYADATEETAQSENVGGTDSNTSTEDNDAAPTDSSAQTDPNDSSTTQDENENTPTDPPAQTNLDDIPKTPDEPLVQTELAVVITAEQYTALTDEQKAAYTRVEANDQLFITYEESPGQPGTAIPNGNYVKKGTDVYFCMPFNIFKGQIITLFHDSTIDDKTDINYFSPDGTGKDWIYRYTIAEDDIALIAFAADDTCPVNVTPQEYAGFPSERQIYYAKANIQSPAYVWIGDDETGFAVTSGNYVLKGTGMWIAMYREDYMDNDILVNGQIVNATSSGGSNNFGMFFEIYSGENVLNITTQPYTGSKSKFDIDVETGIYAMYYVDGWTNGGEIYNGSEIRLGTPILIGAYKNMIAGCDITVNGKVVPLQLNGDGTHMLYYYETEAGDIVIRRVPRAELTDYEKENFVSVNFGNDISVSEFPYSAGNYPDEPHIYYDSGDIVAKGTTLRLWVSAGDYAGKILKINGQMVNMTKNGDGDYIGDYTLPCNASALSIALENAPVIPSSPTTTTTATVIPTPSTPTEGTAVSITSAPSEKSVINDIKRSGKSSINYNAEDAGVTEDILKSFAQNKNAKTLTAKFDGFKVKINKSDIKNAKALEDIDFTLSDKKVVSNSQIKKLSALKNSQNVLQLNFENGADISGIKGVKLQVNAGKKLNGSTAVIYERKGNKLVKHGTTEVNNGYVSFNTDHLGQFVIAVK